MSVFGALQAVFRVGTALVAQIADSLPSGGNARGANAVDWQTVRGAATNVASGAQSVINGGESNTASGLKATIGGGQGNVANNNFTTVAGGTNNTAGNASATVGGGSGNNATGATSTIAGGSSNAAGGTQSFVGGGVSNSASGANTAIAGGSNNSASASLGWVPGGSFATTRGVVGRGAWAANRIAATGDAQCGEHPLLRQTTDATTTRLTSDNAVAATANTINMPDFSSYAGVLTVTAKATGSTAAAAWRLNVSAVRGSGVGSVVVYEGTGAAIAPTASNGTGSTWRLDIAADTTNGGIAVTVTGAAATTINWSARFSNVEAVTAS